MIIFIANGQFISAAQSGRMGVTVNKSWKNGFAASVDHTVRSAGHSSNLQNTGLIK